MSSNRFHKAAKDGLVEVLKEATKRDCNAKDEQGMTPTLYAAFHGHLDALRLLCGRGGDPDKSDCFGNTALHLAAAQGHKSVVTFLVNFGANVFAMDIDERTPQDMAGMNNREDILRFLDGITAKLETTDKKKTKALKEKAKKDAEKRIKEFNKRQTTAEKLQKRQVKDNKHSMMSTLKSRIKSGSLSNLTQVGAPAPRNSFSEIVNKGTMSRNTNSTIQRKLANKFKNNYAEDEDDFKISEVEDGKKSVRSLHGLRRDSEIMLGGKIDDPKRGRLDGVFDDDDESSDHKMNESNLTRSVSQPDFMQALNGSSGEVHHNDAAQNHEPGSIFVRPGMGSLAFRRSITNTLHNMSFAERAIDESSIGSARFDDDLSVSESSEDESPSSPLERFLTAWNLGEYLPRFEAQEIDLDTLLILTESDLKTLNLPLGPYRRLVNAITERKNALENPGEVTDGML